MNSTKQIWECIVHNILTYKIFFSLYCRHNYVLYKSVVQQSFFDKNFLFRRDPTKLDNGNSRVQGVWQEPSGMEIIAVWGVLKQKCRPIIVERVGGWGLGGGGMDVFWNYTLEFVHIVVNFKFNIPLVLFLICFHDKNIVLR